MESRKEVSVGYHGLGEPMPLTIITKTSSILMRSVFLFLTGHMIAWTRVYSIDIFLAKSQWLPLQYVWWVHARNVRLVKDIYNKMRHLHSGALNAENGGGSTLSAEHPTSCRYKRPILSIPLCEARQCPQICVDGIIFFGFGNIRAFRHLLVYSQNLEAGSRRHRNNRKMHCH